MARPLRVEFPGAFYHIIHRGNSGCDIFINERDCERFIEYLEEAVSRYGIRIHTYCLMTTHYHMIIETPQANLSAAVKWINVSYAAYFNRKRDRFGHLFQGRFKSILIDADEYLKPLSRYIHLNPIRASIIEKIETYPFSSYSAFIGKVKPPKWLEINWLLSLFGKDRKTACINYRDYVEGIDIADVKDPGKDTVAGFILGGNDFVSWVKDAFLSKRSEGKEIPQLRELSPRRSPEFIVNAVCSEFGCDADLILKKGGKKNLPRDAAIYLCRELTGKSGVDLGQYFGISGAGITVRSNHITRELNRNRKLKRQIGILEKRIVNN